MDYEVASDVEWDNASTSMWHGKSDLYNEVNPILVVLRAGQIVKVCLEDKKRERSVTMSLAKQAGAEGWKLEKRILEPGIILFKRVKA